MYINPKCTKSKDLSNPLSQTVNNGYLYSVGNKVIDMTEKPRPDLSSIIEDRVTKLVEAKIAELLGT
jgi:hypothetical protein